jgi:DNA-binding MarR family transcriptional regulator
MDAKERIIQASELRELWNTLLLNFDIDICIELLKGCQMIDLKILKLLYEHPNIKIKDIINILKVPNSTMTNAMNRLSKRGLLERKIDQQDYRSFELELTVIGKTAVEEHISEENKLFEDILYELKDAEKFEFIRLFKKIVASKISTL